MNNNMKLCPYCAEEISANAILCKHCKSRLDTPDFRRTIMGLYGVELRDRRKYLGYCGSFLLAAGTFCPILTLPLVGSVNYFSNGKGDGVILIAMAVASVIFSAKYKFKYLWYTGLFSSGLLVFTLLHLNLRLSKLSEEISSRDNMFSGLADAVIGTVSVSWGFFVLSLGSAALILSALMRNRVAD